MKELLAPFTRKMAPLALTAALLTGVLLPASWQHLALQEKRAEAQSWARQLAARLEQRAAERPGLWAYDSEYLEALSRILSRAPTSAHLRLDLPRREGVFQSGPPPQYPISAWALIQGEGRRLGRLRVQLSGERLYWMGLKLWLIASLMGLLLGLALLALPLITLGRVERRRRGLWDALQDANSSLEARVEERTAELQRREQELSRLGARLLAVQEEERARISRDLHDELGQLLTGLRLRLTAMEPMVERAGRQHLQSALEAVDLGVEQIRNLAHALRPPELDALGLSSALKAHAESWAEMAQISLKLELQDPPSELAELFFRIAQEALTNVARHAQAEHVRLELAPIDDGWRLIVEDDGCGLSKESQRQGLGLLGARERAEQAGGYLDLEQSSLGGLKLLAWLEVID